LYTVFQSHYCHFRSAYTHWHEKPIAINPHKCPQSKGNERGLGTSQLLDGVSDGNTTKNAEECVKEEV
jgi:hypothetical protein